jgi:nucleotide-binding universal stress UspA family protein
MRTTGADRSIVAGIDGSDGSLAALDWAAEAASARDRTLELVYCEPWTPPVQPEPALVPPLPGHDVLEEAVTRCRLTAPGVRLSAIVTAAAPAGTLIELSARAELVVVGATGSGGASGVGSVADVVASYARCPVVVVRGGQAATARAARPVVVGIDRSGASTGVLGFAFDEAARRHTRLVALHGWDHRDERAATARTVVEDALTGWHDKHPDVAVDERPVHASPAEALAIESLGAALVVVGASDRPVAGCTVLGPVSAELLGLARCPVAVVRSTDRAPRGRPWLRPVGPLGES